MKLFLCDNCDTLAQVEKNGNTIKLTKCKCESEKE
jgi:hypothetical protein